MHGNAVKVKIAAPALDGRANAALLEFLARELGVPRSAVTLVSGAKSREKMIHIDGLDETAARDRLLAG